MAKGIQVPDPLQAFDDERESRRTSLLAQDRFAQNGLDDDDDLGKCQRVAFRDADKSMLTHAGDPRAFEACCSGNQETQPHLSRRRQALPK